MQLVDLLIATDSMSTYPRLYLGYRLNAGHANSCLEPKRRKMPLMIALQACAKLVDQKVDRVHIIRIKRPRWLVFGRYVCHCVVKCRLEISDRGRERCDGLLLDLCLVAPCRHANEGGNGAKHQELYTVSCSTCTVETNALTFSCVLMLFCTAVPMHHAAYLLSSASLLSS